MEEFSTIVYKCPGLQHGPNGKTYNWVGVSSKEELADKLKDGWCESLAEAVGLEVKDDAPPTRKELEEKAESLGIKFDGRMKDVTLLAKINEKV